MRAILHAKFDAHVAKLSSTSDKVTRISPSPGLRDSSVEEFEAALTKARASWRADRGPTDCYLQWPHRAASVETLLGGSRGRGPRCPYGERQTGAWAATFGGQLMALRRDYPTRIFGHCIKWRASILGETSARPACFIGHEQ